MQTLTQICSKKLKALRNITYTERETQCRNCDDYNKECYVPLNTQESIRQGFNAYVLMREKR